MKFAVMKFALGKNSLYFSFQFLFAERLHECNTRIDLINFKFLNQTRFMLLMLCDYFVDECSSGWSFGPRNYKRTSIKFIYSEKATKISRNLPLTFDDSTYSQKLGEDLQNFVAFSEYMNFKVQINLFQKHFLHQLTHNMTTDCSLNYEFST